MIEAKMKTEEEISFQQARSNVYLLLANVFLGNWQKLKEAATIIEVPVDDPISSIVNELRTTPLEELEIQYDNLFVVPASFFVPPFAAHYLPFKDEEEEDQYFNKINHYYQTFDFNLPFEQFGRVDHLGYLLAFIAYVNEATKQLIKEGDEENIQQSIQFQKNFLNNDLQSWIGTLEKEVSQKLNRGLLLNAVRYLHQFIEWDIEELGKL